MRKRAHGTFLRLNDQERDILAEAEALTGLGKGDILRQGLRMFCNQLNSNAAGDGLVDQSTDLSAMLSQVQSAGQCHSGAQAIPESQS